jgi:hypothetical protein
MYFIQQSAQRPLAFILCLVNGSANFDPWVVERPAPGGREQRQNDLPNQGGNG